MVLCPNQIKACRHRKGPSLIAENNKWPDQPLLSETTKSEKEAKIIKNKLATIVKQKDLFDFSLDKDELQKY